MWEIPGFDKTHARVFFGAQATWLNGAIPLQEQWLFGPVLQWTYYWD
jgi:hypothetical protein